MYIRIAGQNDDVNDLRLFPFLALNVRPIALSILHLCFIWVEKTLKTQSIALSILRPLSFAIFALLSSSLFPFVFHFRLFRVVLNRAEWFEDLFSIYKT